MMPRVTTNSDENQMRADGTYVKSQGGTEQMNDGLMTRVDKALLEKFFIIKSRVRQIDSHRPNILWLHDMWNDREVQHLKDPESRARFVRLVFVSNYQLATYNLTLSVPYSQSVVLRNAIDPIACAAKEPHPIRLIYHTTPHRGLGLLVPAVERLAQHWGHKIHLDVYSSFSIYGREERDLPYEPLFQRIREHPQMTYHGFQPNPVVRAALQRAHIFAYPCIWHETACIAAIEAMSAGCEIVCPNLAALPETTGYFATLYPFHEDPHQHATIFTNVLNQAILDHHSSSTQQKLQAQKTWADRCYNWDTRAREWTAMLRGLEP
jgi:glycosyltransferase involved in cell wall biosynthesis